MFLTGFSTQDHMVFDYMKPLKHHKVLFNIIYPEKIIILSPNHITTLCAFKTCHRKNITLVFKNHTITKPPPTIYFLIFSSTQN
ncbi:hypothetical protein Hanom_Chr07g00620041 [Helianthus anomalus]